MRLGIGIVAVVVLLAGIMACHPQTQGTDQEPGPVPVTIGIGDGVAMVMRAGEPYYIKGVGGNYRLDLAAALGANSLRTWGVQGLGQVLDEAQELGMTVLVGIYLSPNPNNYQSNAMAANKASLQDLLHAYAKHPAILMWALGNEINSTSQTPEMWQFVNELALLIQEHDPMHPVITVLAQRELPSTIALIKEHAPALQGLGINSYGGLLVLADELDALDSGLPYIVTEWGPQGHWEADICPWERPIDESSSAKAERYLAHYELIDSRRDLFVGSYAFYWGQKQERTPTWYSLFTEYRQAELGLPGYSYGAVDILQKCWTGTYAENTAPILQSFSIQGLDTKLGATLQSSTPYVAEVLVTDPNGDTLDYTWEILEDPIPSNAGGGWEPRPRRVGSVTKGSEAQWQFSIAEAGAYRLFVYVSDGQGHAATANIPLLVPAIPEASSEAD
jgi:hypothetical protein